MFQKHDSSSSSSVAVDTTCCFLLNNMDHLNLLCLSFLDTALKVELKPFSRWDLLFAQDLDGHGHHGDYRILHCLDRSSLLPLEQQGIYLIY